MTKNNFFKTLALSAVLFLGTVLQAQIKVGNNPTSINTNSVLEMESTNKGMLLPRLALTNTTAASPLIAHVAGMTVYNTATAGDVTPGFYYNNGTVWVRVGSATASNNTTSGQLITITNGAGATFTAMTVAVDTTALKTFISNAVQTGSITGKNTTAGSLVTVTNGTGATFTAMTVGVDTTALKTFLNGKIQSSVSAPLSGDGTAANPLTITRATATNGVLTTVTNGTNSTFTALKYDVDTTALKTFLNNKVQVTSASPLTGNGTTASPLTIGQNGATSGQILTWNGTAWVPQNASSGADNWGTQTASTSAPISGNGTSGSPITMTSAALAAALKTSPAMDTVAAIARANGDGDAWGVTGENQTSNVGRTGSVAIGIPTPTNRLHVSAASNPIRLEGLQSGSTTDSIMTIDPTGIVRMRHLTLVANSSNNDWKIVGNSGTISPTTVGTTVGTNNFLGTTDARNLALATNSITRVIIDQNGNIIGGNGTSSSSTSNSLIWGLNNISTGVSNIVAGEGNRDSAARTFVVGLNNLVSSSATNSIVSGTGNLVRFGGEKIVVGNAIIDSSAKSLIVGEGHIIGKKSYAVAVVGRNSSVDCYACGVLGNAATVKADASFSIGNQNFIYARNSIAGGDQNVINNEYCTALGSSNTLSGDFGFGIGNSNLIVGTNAGALGAQNKVECTGSLNNALALGNINNVRGNRVIAIGYNDSVYADQSVAIGNNIVIKHANSLGLGDAAKSVTANSFTAQYPGGYRLFSNSTSTTGVSLGAGAGTWTSVSDRRSKDNIEILKYGLQAVLALNPTMYNYKGSDKLSLGFIAQEVKQVVPEVVELTGMGPEKDYLGVKYTELIPVLTKAIQEQQQQIELLKKEIKDLKSR